MCVCVCVCVRVCVWGNGSRKMSTQHGPIWPTEHAKKRNRDKTKKFFLNKKTYCTFRVCAQDQSGHQERSDGSASWVPARSPHRAQIWMWCGAAPGKRCRKMHAQNSSCVNRRVGEWELVDRAARDLCGSQRSLSHSRYTENTPCHVPFSRQSCKRRHKPTTITSLPKLPGRAINMHPAGLSPVLHTD